MVYKALYRTYRPQKFSEVMGQDHIVRTLQNSIENKKTSHAYLFSGPRGTGKTSVARIFAKALNCSSPVDREPCGECLSCQEIAGSLSPDVVEIDAASNNGVDEIREIRDKVKFLPSGSKYKIYIIDEVHMLSQGAFNALLKTLEEPPKHVIFILATTEPHKVIPTILSRCQRFDFKTLTVQEISEVIKTVSEKEGFEITDEAVIGIAESAEGGMRDALSYLDQAASFTDDVITINDVNNVTGNLNLDKIVELAVCFDEKNINDALKIVNELVVVGKEPSKIVSSILQFYRDCLLYKNVDTTLFSKYIFEKEEFKTLVDKLESEQIFYFIDILSDVQNKIRISSTPIIYLEVAIIKMIYSSTEDFEYNKRITKLEDRIKDLSNFSGDSPQSLDVDSDRINIIEGRLNKVIHELSKLELHKFIEKVEAIENKETEFAINDNSLIDSEEFSNLKAELEKLKDHYNNLENLSSPTTTHDFENEYKKIKEQFKELSDEVQNIKNSTKDRLVENNNEDVENRIQKLKDIILGMQADMYSSRRNNQVEVINIDAIKEELDDIYLNKFVDIEKELETIKSKKQNSETGLVDSDIKYELDKIKDKINNIESKVYKLMSGELSKSTKKTKQKVNKEQIGLFGDEMISLNQFEKPVQEQVDFDSSEVEDTSSSDTLIHETELDLEVNQETINEEVEVSEVEENFEDGKIEETLDNEVNKEENEVEEDVLSSQAENEKNENTIIKTIKTDEEEIVEREKSSLVRKINVGNDSVVDEIEESYKAATVQKPKEVVVDTKEENENLENKTTTRSYKPSLDMASDEFSRYDVKVLERILHDSRTEEARDDRKRLINLWKNLDKSVPKSQSHIASLLQDGQVVAIGKKEFVLTYPNAALCNQVMRLAFKEDSLKLLYDFLGDTYNYLALPEDIWLEKRTEYINQYNIGTRFPKLTPIIDSRLNVVEDNKKYLNKEMSSRSKAVSFFGEELVKVE